MDNKEVNKPKEILELEILLSKRLNRLINFQQKTLEQLKNYAGEYTYSIDSDNKVNGLGLMFGKVKDINFVASFPHLQVLDLNDCELTDLPKELFRLKELTWLCVSANYLSHIPQQFLQLKKLEHLDLGYINSFTDRHITFPNFLKELTTLRELFIHGNRLTEIPEWVYELKNLANLNIFANNITKISEKILNLEKLSEINTLYLDITYPPPYIVKQGLKAIKAYFRGLRLGYIENNHIKIILVGNAHVGKTMMFNHFTKAKTPIDFAGSTHGIQVGNFNIEIEEGETVNVNLWDFGGQEYYHATHRLFFSQNVLYLLLWEQETDKHGVYTFTSEQDSIVSSQGLQYFNSPITTQITTEGFPIIDWVNNIRFYAKNSSIILVQNKIDTQIPKYNFPQFEENIRSARVSLKTLQGVDELEQYIKNAIKELKHYKYKIPTSWQKVIEYISSLGDNYFGIRYDSLKREIEAWDNEIINDLPQIINFYCERGDILWIEKNELLKNYIFPQPWRVTNTIYSILNRKVADENRGEFTKESIYSLYNNQKEHVDFCLELMKEFEIIFSFKNEDKEFIAPQYLDKKIEDKERLEEHRYYTQPQEVFVLYYPEFMPRSLFTRFMCNYGMYADKMMYGKEEIYFAKNRIGSFVTCNYSKGIITVAIQDKNQELTKEIFDEFLRISENKETLELYCKSKKRFVSLIEIKEYKSFYNDEFWFVFEKEDKQNETSLTKEANNKKNTTVMNENQTNSTIQKALKHIEDANYGGYFEEMDKIVPTFQRPVYNKLKGKFIAGDTPYDFHQTLTTFARELNNQSSSTSNPSLSTNSNDMPSNQNSNSPINITITNSPQNTNTSINTNKNDNNQQIDFKAFENSLIDLQRNLGYAKQEIEEKINKEGENAQLTEVKEVIEKTIEAAEKIEEDAEKAIEGDKKAEKSIRKDKSGFFRAVKSCASYIPKIAEKAINPKTWEDAQKSLEAAGKFGEQLGGMM